MSVRSRLTPLLFALTVAAVACNDDGNGPDVIPPGAADITQDILNNRTLYAETTYTLKGYIHVANGATLTIQPGTTIQGDYNTLGASLFILRGARIIAQGTADAPIVFTSSRPAGSRQPGDWGGLIIVGNAVINRNVATGLLLEGSGEFNEHTTDTTGKNYDVFYDDGNSNADDSGALSYVRVEFAGFAPANGAELNSFTFAAVGSGTELSYLQALAGLDDSFEWFGGAADAHHIVSYEAGDDHFDMSEGYVGRIQYAIALQTTQIPPRANAIGTASSDPQGVENDGCNGAGCATDTHNSTPLTIPILANFTLVGTGDVASSGTSGGVAMHLRRGTGGYYVNGIVARWPRGAFAVRDPATYTRAGSTATPDMNTTDLAIRNVLLTNNSVVFQTGTGLNTFDEAGNAITTTATATAGLFTAFPATVTTTTTEAAFDWTPPAATPAASGGLATFTGKLATKAGTVITGTSFLGAAQPGGTKWWQGWTKYAQN